MTRVDKLIQARPWKRVIVTGLVLDFCVKETAFNVKKLFPDAEVVVPLELAHPACEGGILPDFVYPPLGLGTTPIIERTAQEYAARGIKLVSAPDLAPGFQVVSEAEIKATGGARSLASRAPSLLPPKQRRG